jgi:hypothetical protein
MLIAYKKETPMYAMFPSKLLLENLLKDTVI